MDLSFNNSETKHVTESSTANFTVNSNVLIDKTTNILPYPFSTSVHGLRSVIRTQCTVNSF